MKGFYPILLVSSFPELILSRRKVRLETCIADGPQMVTKRGTEAAVLVPVGEWRTLQAAARPSLKQLLLSDVGRTDLLTPQRGVARRRKFAVLE